MRSYMLFPCFALLAAAAPAATTPPPVASQIAQAPDLQATTTAVGGGAANKTIAPQDKKICKQLERTGSRLPNRACLTAKEWKQVEDDLSR